MTPTLHLPKDDIVCPCGNTPRSDGFFPCDTDGNEIEPDHRWSGLYICPVCNRQHRFLEEEQ